MYKYALWPTVHTDYLCTACTWLSQHNSRQQVSRATPVPSWTKIQLLMVQHPYLCDGSHSAVKDGSG